MAFEKEEKNYETNVIIGRNPVLEALKAEKLIDTIYVNNESGGSIGHICALAKQQGIVVKNVNDVKLSQLSDGASHQGVVAVGACAEYVSVDNILAVSANKGTAPFIIICDEIEDPHNLGAIIRTAESAGADGIIIPKEEALPLTTQFSKPPRGRLRGFPSRELPT